MDNDNDENALSEHEDEPIRVNVVAIHTQAVTTMNDTPGGTTSEFVYSATTSTTTTRPSKNHKLIAIDIQLFGKESTEGYRLKALVDTGSSHDLLAARVVADLNFPMTKAVTTKFELADETAHTVERRSTAEPILMKIDGNGQGPDFEECLHFTVLPTLSYACVLGLPFIKKYRINFNWDQYTLILTPSEGPKVVIPFGIPGTLMEVDDDEISISMLESATQLRKLLHEPGVECIKLQLTSVTREYENPVQVFSAEVPQEGSDNEFVVGPMATVEERSALRQLVNRFQDVIVDELPRRTAKNPLPKELWHKITLRPGAELPTRERMHRLNPTVRAALEKYVTKLVKEGVLSVADDQTSYCSPCWLVKKADGKSFRMVTDFRLINQICKKKSSPMMGIRELVDMTANSNYRSNLDLISAYHQITVDPESRQFLRCRINGVAMVYSCLPMGFVGSSQALSNCLSRVFGHIKGLVFYADDILVLSASFEEHLKTLTAMFQAMREAHLYLKRTKLKFIQDDFVVLGYRIKGRVISIDPNRVAAVRNWRVPRTRRQLRGILGLASWFRAVCPRLSELTSDLQALAGSSGPTRLRLTESQVQSFERLKAALTEGPNLVVSPDWSRLWRIRSDASDLCGGGILEQRYLPDEPQPLSSEELERAVESYGPRDRQAHNRGWRPVSYYSFKFADAGTRYPIDDKECLALLRTLEAFRDYTRNVPLIVETDNQSVSRLLFHQREPSPRQARWIAQLGMYDLRVHHLPGSENVCADVLSRYVNEDHPRPEMVITSGPSSPDDEPPITVGTVAVTLSPEVDIRRRIRDLNEDDVFFGPIFKIVSSNRAEFEDHSLKDRYHIARNGLLYLTKLHDEDFHRLCVPDDMELIKVFLTQAHDGHAGYHKMLGRLTRVYFRHLHRHAQKFVASCPKCQVTRTGVKPIRATTRNIHRLRKPCAGISLDFAGPFPVVQAGNESFDSVMVVTDNWSHLVKFIPASTGDTAMKTARRLIRDWCLQYGLPQHVVCDHDPRFIGSSFKEVLQSFGIFRLSTSSAGNPRANGIAEASVKKLKKYLRSYVDFRPGDWFEHLQAAEFYVNTTVHSETGVSPYKLAFNFEPLTPLLMLSHPDDPVLVGSSVERFRESHNAIVASAHDSFVTSRDTRAGKDFNQRRKRNYRVGDKVYVTAERMQTPAARARPTRAFRPRWVGPFEVLKRERDT